MPALVALVLLSLLFAGPQGRPGRRAPRAERPEYPYRIVPVGAVWGFLMDGPFRGPGAVYFEPTAGELFVGDVSGLIGIYEEDGTPLFAFGRPPLLDSPRRLHVTPEGNIYALQGSDGTVHAFSYRGEPRGTLSFEYPALDGLPAGSAVVTAFDVDDQGRWYVADRDLPQLLAFEADLRFRFAIRTRRAGAQFQSLSDVAVSPDGLIAVTDQASTPVQVFDAEGHFVAGFGERDLGAQNFTHATACSFDEQGYLFVVDMLRHDVKIFEPTGTFVGSFGGWRGPETRGRGPGELRYPMDVSLGPDGQVWVAERYGLRVQAFRREPREGEGAGEAGGDRPGPPAQEARQRPPAGTRRR